MTFPKLSSAFRNDGRSSEEARNPWRNTGGDEVAHTAEKY